MSVLKRVEEQLCESDSSIGSGTSFLSEGFSDLSDSEKEDQKDTEIPSLEESSKLDSFKKESKEEK